MKMKLNLVGIINNKFFLLVTISKTSVLGDYFDPIASYK
jgi:hypothetical protein